LQERLLFRTNAILGDRQWYRLFSSALIHADFVHLCFNLLAFYSFAQVIEWAYGGVIMVVVYAVSILGGSLLSLHINRYRDYAALGASGGVCGVIFAALFLVPGTNAGIILLPFSIPGPVFAIGYLIV